MTEARNHACLAVKTLTTTQLVWTEDFDGDCPAESRVPRAVDLAHATRAESGHDLE